MIFIYNMQKILIATGNEGKAGEMLEVLSDLPFEFVTLKELGIQNDVEETGLTHEENALLKARYFFEKSGGLPTIGEDSGISVNALSGELGIYTRRWGVGEKASDEEWLAYFLERMQEEQDRSASFFCAAAFIDNNEEKIFTGQTVGVLTKTPQCVIPKGIPVSALFVPEGADKVYACLSKHEKNAISHRGKAMHQLKNFLENYFS